MMGSGFLEAMSGRADCWLDTSEYGWLLYSAVLAYVFLYPLPRVVAEVEWKVCCFLYIWRDVMNYFRPT